MNFECRCLGIDGRTECDNAATQEDGLCDRCRSNDCEGKMALRVSSELRLLADESYGESNVQYLRGVADGMRDRALRVMKERES